MSALSLRGALSLGFSTRALTSYRGGAAGRRRVCEVGGLRYSKRAAGAVAAGGLERRAVLRSLVGGTAVSAAVGVVPQTSSGRRASMAAEGPVSVEQALEEIRMVVPELGREKHKGQAGKIAVIGGCREYTGAPFFASFSALRLGADLSHVFCSKEAAVVIKSYSPELIVHPVLRESWSIDAEGGTANEQAVKDQVLSEVSKWLSRFDCLVIGPGMGRDPLLMACVADIMREARKQQTPMVIDGDGLSIVCDHPDIVDSYPLAILTPNVNEHKRLVAAVVNQDRSQKPDDADRQGQLKTLADRFGNVTIVQKGAADIISDGVAVLECGVWGSPRRCGGQGDVLSGSIATFMAWAQTARNSEQGSAMNKPERLFTNPTLLAAYAGCLIVRRAALVAFGRHKRSTVTGDIIEALPDCVEEMFPVPPYQPAGPKL